MRSQIVSVQNRIFREELTSRIDEIERIQHVDRPRVAELAQEAMIYAEQLGDFHGYAYALTRFAWASAQMNHLEDALAASYEALELVRMHKFLDIEWRVINTLAITFARMGAHEEAISLVRYQLEIALNLESEEAIFIARHDMAVLLLHFPNPEIKNKDESVRLMEMALDEMPREIRESPGGSLIYVNACKMFSQMGMPEKGMVYGEVALRNEQRLGDERGIARACTALTFPAADRGDIAQATLYLHQARGLLKKESNSDAELQKDMHIAQAHILMCSQRPLEAMEWFEKCYQISIEDNDLQTAIGMLHVMRNISTNEGLQEKLADIYRRMSEDVPRLQQQNGDARLNVLRMVFAADKAGMKAEIGLSQQKSAVMAHLAQEFRTPLNTIQNISDRMGRITDDLSPDERRTALQEITLQVNTMRVMLDDVIDLLQPEEYAVQNHLREPITLLRLSEIILTELRRYRLDGTRVTVHVPMHQTEYPLPVKALQMSLVHVLVNALKFSRREVDFTLGIDQGWLMARVTDKGIGIPETEQQAVFQPLYRASNNQISGHGLGLAIVNKQIGSVGGTITLESTQGMGTTIIIHMPI